jgi:putative membrane-bound dehydrogenase-like protein
MISKRFAGFFVTLILFTNCSHQKVGDDRSPEAGLADLKVYPGLRVALFAAEPDLTNPTNMDIDARGRVWVCEAYNYRSKLNPKNQVRKEGDRILILEDTNGDGRADSKKIFYQGRDVDAALGICILGNKVIVSCSPNVLVFTDEDGDDKPDKKEILFRGIQGIQHDHGMHAFTFGADGYLYFNMGNEGKSLLDANGDTVVDISGRKVVTNGKPFRGGLVLRCKPDGSAVEVLGNNFRNNYEVTVDPYGTIWQSDNDDDGNKGTRINYVMEGGNFGYQDEMTGAFWTARRTNMEKEIPLRHWHLNDPGVVPNLLQTGSGSPTGITMYEGDLLPRIFQGQMIHAEAGHNVVRAYPVEYDRAGYKATIVNILEGQKDQWFRPSDVAIAPDGSLFVADWYDPGVGGHQVQDLERGRVYRVAPETSYYKISPADVSSPASAVKELTNPNSATRYNAFVALEKFGSSAEQALLTLWNSDNQRHRAEAFWLLIKINNRVDDYINKAIADANPDIRMAGIRAIKELKKDIIPVAAKLVKDPSAQVRREVALALRGSKDPAAAEIWADLALQHDGSDRWYLEALGIGEQGNEDLFFNAWRKKAGGKLNTAGARDIIWRSRSKDAMPLLAQMIRSANEKDMLRYYRAFDFQKDASKQTILAQLALQTTGEKQLYALKEMDASRVTMTPALHAALNKVLDKYKERVEFVDLVISYKVSDRAPGLIKLALHYPDSIAGQDAVKGLLAWGRTDLLNDVLKSKKKEDIKSFVRVLSHVMNDPKAISLMERIMEDSTQDLYNRKLAIRSFVGPWEAEDRLMDLAKENKIPEVLHIAAAGAFQSAWRPVIREDGPKYLKLPGSKEGKPLPAIAVLVERKGDPKSGKLVFNSICTNCHRLNNEGLNFGPDLSEIGAKLSKEAIYTSILFPDQGIGFGYEGWRFKMKDGTEAFGMIASETEDKVDIKYMATQQTLDKKDIVSRVQLETSLMSQNLQSLMSESELVDLVEYLSTLKKIPDGSERNSN